MKIVVLPGDGIGPEIMGVTVDVLEAVSQKFHLELTLQHDIAGHDSMKLHGATVTPALLEKVTLSLFARTPRGFTPTEISSPAAVKC